MIPVSNRNRRLLVLLAAALACRSQPRAETTASTQGSVAWPTPPDWKQEAFSLPPDFAPSFPFHGREELRFAPGFYQTAAADYWSYDIAWLIDSAPAIDSATVSRALSSYFRGLSQAVGGAKYHFDSTRFAAQLSSAGSGPETRLIGQVMSYDPFTTGLPLVLNVEAESRRCSGNSAILLLLSPQPRGDSVWAALRRTAAGFRCA